MASAGIEVLAIVDDLLIIAGVLVILAGNWLGVVLVALGVGWKVVEGEIQLGGKKKEASEKEEREDGLRDANLEGDETDYSEGESVEGNGDEGNGDAGGEGDGGGEGDSGDGEE